MTILRRHLSFFACFLCSCAANIFSAAYANDFSPEVRILAAVMVGEARGEGDFGMQLVGEVVLNRVKSKNYGDTIERVIYAPWQFSAFNHSDPNYKIMKRLIFTGQSGYSDVDYAYERALIIADGILTQKIEKALPQHVYHYYAHESITLPYWARNAHVMLVYKNHTFFAGVDS